MPYSNLSDLPENIRNILPAHAQEIYLAAYNNAVEQYQDPNKRRGNETLEEVAHKVAWSAVKKEYNKEKSTGVWRKK